VKNKLKIFLFTGVFNEVILSVRNFFFVGGTNSMRSNFYLIFELCDGDLAGIIKNNRIKFTLEHIKCIMNQILDGKN
jgi:serine/threonine protein kinase